MATNGIYSVLVHASPALKNAIVSILRVLGLNEVGAFTQNPLNRQLRRRQAQIAIAPAWSWIRAESTRDFIRRSGDAELEAEWNTYYNTVTANARLFCKCGMAQMETMPYKMQVMNVPVRATLGDPTQFQGNVFLFAIAHTQSKRIPPTLIKGIRTTYHHCDKQFTGICLADLLSRAPADLPESICNEASRAGPLYVSDPSVRKWIAPRYVKPFERYTASADQQEDDHDDEDGEASSEEKKSHEADDGGEDTDAMQVVNDPPAETRAPDSEENLHQHVSHLMNQLHHALDRANQLCERLEMATAAHTLSAPLPYAGHMDDVRRSPRGQKRPASFSTPITSPYKRHARQRSNDGPPEHAVFSPRVMPAMFDIDLASEHHSYDNLFDTSMFDLFNDTTHDDASGQHTFPTLLPSSDPRPSQSPSGELVSAPEQTPPPAPADPAPKQPSKTWRWRLRSSSSSTLLKLNDTPAAQLLGTTQLVRFVRTEADDGWQVQRILNEDGTTMAHPMQFALGDEDEVVDDDVHVLESSNSVALLVDTATHTHWQLEPPATPAFDGDATDHEMTDWEIELLQTTPGKHLHGMASCIPTLAPSQVNIIGPVLEDHRIQATAVLRELFGHLAK